MSDFQQPRDWLHRLDPGAYRGSTCVHWSLTMQDRTSGWLIPILYYKFRELLTHAMFGYGLCCPIDCCMPDHMHLLWLGPCATAIGNTCERRTAAQPAETARLKQLLRQRETQVKPARQWSR